MEKFTQAPVGLDIDQTVSSNSTAISNLGNKFVNVGVASASASQVLSKVQAVINAVTTNGSNVNFIGIGRNAGDCHVGGLLYDGKLYGGGYYSTPWESGYWKLDNGTLSVSNYAIKSDIAYVEYDIPNSTAQNVFNLPSGMTTAILVGAACFSKYQTWVDSTYANGTYFGNVAFTQGNGKFAYTPYTAGESTKVRFAFMKIG